MILFAAGTVFGFAAATALLFWLGSRKKKERRPQDYGPIEIS